MKVNISFSTLSVKAEIYNTATGRAIYAALPINRNANIWGDEIYFETGVHCELEEGASPDVKVGDLAYWPNMPAFCIFFGPTPVSRGQAPRAASAVNVFGKLLDVNPDLLRSIPDGENISVERLD